MRHAPRALRTPHRHRTFGRFDDQGESMPIGKLGARLRRLFGGDDEGAAPVPPRLDEDPQALLARTAEDTVCFRHVFPPRFDRRPTSFLGGLPLAAQPFAWPSGPGSNGRTESFTFLGQIDCRDLPPLARRGLLPDSGIFYFFMDWKIAEGLHDDDATFANLVLHAPAAGGLAEIRAPGNLATCYGEDAVHRYPWLEHTERGRRGYPRTFPQWAVEPVVLRSVAAEYPGDDDRAAVAYEELRDAEQENAIRAAFGAPVERPRRPYPPPASEKIRRPAPAFPEAWISVEVFAGTLLQELHRKLEVEGSDDARLTAAWENVRKEAHGWVARARAQDLFAPVDERSRAELWAWCEALDRAAGRRPDDPRDARRLNECLDDAFARGPDYCLAHSAQAAALIGAEARAALRWKHAPVVSDEEETRVVLHQMLASGSNVAGAPQHLRDTHLLLMQLDSDDGLDWSWADGGALRYWITPQDLAARRFDRISVTLGEP